MSLILKNQFELTQTPVAGSVVVRVNGVVQSSGYSVNSRTLEFSTPPPINASIEVSYLHSPSTLFSEVVLSQQAAPETIVVRFNGTVVSPSDYVFDGPSNRILFNTTPADNTTISVNYLRQMPLLTSFAVGASVVPGTVDVLVNGVLTTNYTFNSGTSSVVFNTPPPDGASITVSLQRDNGPVLDYALALPPGTTDSDVYLSDAGSGSTVQGFWNGATLEIDGSEFVMGRVIDVLYYDPSLQPGVFTLAQAPVPGAIAFADSGGNTDLCLENPDPILVAGQSVDLSGCTLRPSVDSLVVSYSYVAAVFQSFIVDAASTIPVGKQVSWRVFINGIETTAFSVSGYTVTLDNPPDYDDVIDVELTYAN